MEFHQGNNSYGGILFLSIHYIQWCIHYVLCRSHVCAMTCFNLVCTSLCFMVCTLYLVPHPLYVMPLQFIYCTILSSCYMLLAIGYVMTLLCPMTSSICLVVFTLCSMICAFGAMKQSFCVVCCFDPDKIMTSLECSPMLC